MIEQTKRVYVPGIRYGRGRVSVWELAGVRAADPAEARANLAPFLFGINGRFQLFEKRGGQLIPIEENDE